MMSVHKSETVPCLTMFKQHCCRKDFLGGPDTYRTSLKDGRRWWRGPLLDLRLCASRARSSNLGQLFWWTVTKKERRERTGSWLLHKCLLAYQAILASSSSSIIILDLTYYYKKYSLSKWKTIDYLPKKIESPTYEKRSQIELNQVTLQRHNDSRVGISPPSEPDVKV